jgi:4-amino-4-deoxy-L-arabinose transferase-like glycosyltransferase
VSQDNNSSSSKAVRVGWAVLILATLFICYFSHLGVIGFVGPDEPRYAWIARDMTETGDWITPRLYGNPWFEKPVLYYWGAAASFKLFGVSEASARLPSAISALLATLAMAWLAWKLYGGETARWLLLLLPTTVGMIGFSHAAATDMPFSGMLTIAMVCAAGIIGLTRNGNSQQPSRTPWLALAFFGFFLGLAVLAKGPAAVILSGGAIFFWALFTKRWRDALRCLHPVAIAAFCLTALPWYIICARRNPDFFRVFIIEHNFKRFLTPEFQHVQPFWFYGPVILAALFPWSGLALATVPVSVRRAIERRLDASTALFLSWGAFPVLFFSISKSKLPGYVLPALPVLALLAIRGLETLLAIKKRGQGVLIALLALTPVGVITCVVLSIGGFRSNWLFPSNFATACGALTLLASTAVLTFALSGKLRAALLSGLVAWLCLAMLTYQMVMPWVDPKISPRAISNKIMSRSEIADRVLACRLKRGWRYGLNFYLHRELGEWESVGSVDQYVISSVEGLDQLKKKNIPYQLVDDISDEAILIRITKNGGPTSEINRTSTNTELGAIQRAGFPVAGK